MPSRGSVRSQSGGGAARGSQTLRRGLEVLQVVVDADRALSVSQVAALAGLDRSIAYRLLTTLEEHGLVTQLGGQGFAPGLGLLRLAPRSRQDLIAHTRPVMDELARTVGATIVLSLRDRDQEVCLLCVAPPGDGPFISFREGAAGPLGRGASSLALLALGEPRADERPEISAARARDPFAVVRTTGELRSGTSGLAVAWAGHPDLALSVVFFEGMLEEERAADELVHAARLLARTGGGSQG